MSKFKRVIITNDIFRTMTKDKKLKAEELIINSRRVSEYTQIRQNAVTAAIQCKYLAPHHEQWYWDDVIEEIKKAMI